MDSLRLSRGKLPIFFGKAAASPEEDPSQAAPAGMRKKPAGEQGAAVGEDSGILRIVIVNCHGRQQSIKPPSIPSNLHTVTGNGRLREVVCASGSR